MSRLCNAVLQSGNLAVQFSTWQVMKLKADLQQHCGERVLLNGKLGMSRGQGGLLAHCASCPVHVCTSAQLLLSKCIHMLHVLLQDAKVYQRCSPSGPCRHAVAPLSS